MPQQSVDSAVDCINAEIGIFLFVQRNATVHCGQCDQIKIIKCL